MLDDQLTVLLVEDDPDFANLVQRWLSARSENPQFILNWTDTLAGGLRRLEQGGVEVVVLDLGLPDCGAVEAFSRLHSQAPDVPVVILSHNDSEPLALQMIQQGAQDYLVKAACTSELLVRAIRHTVVRNRTQAARQNPAGRATPTKVIAVVGAQGGVGSTTVATYLAAELREQTGESVLLMDVGFSAGHVCFPLGVEPEYTLSDAVENLHRLDAECWQAIVTAGPGNLEILPSPELTWEIPDQEVLLRLLDTVRSYYAWIVLDVGRLNRLASTWLDWATEILLVTTKNLLSLHQAKRTIDAIERLDIAKDRVRIVLNQHEGSGDLSGGDLTGLFGTSVAATIPLERAELNNACIQRRLAANGCAFRKEVAGLARRVAGLPEERDKGVLESVVSFAKKFRRPAHPNEDLAVR